MTPDGMLLMLVYLQEKNNKKDTTNI